MDVIIQKLHREPNNIIIISSYSGTHIHEKLDIDYQPLPIEMLFKLRYSELDLDKIEGRVF